MTAQQVLANVQGLFEGSVVESWNARPQTGSPSFSERTQIPELRVIDGRQGPDGPPRNASQILSIVFAIVGLLLLIVCANVANLFMARASGRKHEMSVRLAIGAGRGRLIRQLLTESVLLGLIGGGLGTILAWWGKNFLAWLPATQALLIEPQIDGRVLLFACLLSVSTGVVFGLIPGLTATKDLTAGLRTIAAKGRSSRSFVSRSLVVTQVSVSVVLLIGAALFIATLQNLQQVDIGFNPANLILFGVDPQSTEDGVRQFQLYEQMIDSLEEVGGVRSVTMSSTRPLSGSAWTEWVVAEKPSSERQTIYLQSVRWNFFDTLEMPLLAGRALAPNDDRNSPKVAVINEVMARTVFGGENPIGGRFNYADFPDEGPFEVVGVVRDAKYSRLQDGAPATAYLPYLQSEPGPMTFEVRSAIDTAAMVPLIQQAIRRVDPTLPLSRVQTQTEQINQTIGTQRMFAAVSGIFSTVGLLLVSIGLYGVVSFGVNRRINEIGLRMALGAQSRDVLRLVMSDTFFLLGVGALIGISGAIVLTRFIANTLYGVAPHDPIAIVFAIVVTAVVTAFAGYLPARRALRVDPATALRYE
jgi:predicted permease